MSKTHLSRKITGKQQLFLDARATEPTDAGAALAAGVAMSSVHRWKGVPAFWEQYQKITGQTDQTLTEAISTVIDTENRQQLVMTQTEALMATLPGVVQEHIRMALGASKEADRLRAIEKLYAAVGFGKDEAPPVAQQNKAFMTMLDMMAPQVAAEASRRGLPVSSTLKEVISEDFAKTMARLEREGEDEAEEEEG